jgi:hypothetical protein
MRAGLASSSLGLPMMRLALLASLPIAVACVSPRPETKTEAPAARVSPIQDLAGRTRYHVLSAAELSDSAALEAQIASAEDSATEARLRVQSAIETTRIAGADLKLAMEAGDRLEIFVEEDEKKAGRRGFAHYWQLGRAKLDTARAQQAQALLSADSALACTAVVCTSRRAIEMRNHLISASGATREAESIVRIAVMYLRGY